jgi:signal transduction histidine kinase
VHRPRIIAWLRSHPFAFDCALTAVLLVPALGAHWNAPIPAGGRGPSAIGSVLVCLAVLPLAYRRRAPATVLALVTAVQLVLDIVGFPNSGLMSVMIAVYTVAAHTNGQRRARTAQVFAPIFPVVLVVGYLVDRVELGAVVSSLVFLLGAFILGDNLQRRRLHIAELADRAEQAERERELMAQQRAQDERSRIARELHDVVAHSVSLMIIQAGAARRSLATSPQQAEATLHTLEATGRTAMDELRRVLGVLRTEEVHAGKLAPQPSLADVRELVSSDPTLPTELIENGTAPADIPSSVGLSLYRVVQEALTNVRKHAGQVRRVTVRLDYQPDRLMVQIIDDGRGASVAANADGHGLVGMRERMALCGGVVSAGPRPGGGWQVRASAPLRHTVPSAATTPRVPA